MFICTYVCVRTILYNIYINSVCYMLVCTVYVCVCGKCSRFIQYVCMYVRMYVCYTSNACRYVHVKCVPMVCSTVYIRMYSTYVRTYSETLLIQHLYNPAFSLIRPLFEVQSPYISMVRGTP